MDKLRRINCNSGERDLNTMGECLCMDCGAENTIMYGTCFESAGFFR